jgi:hypothetical protein
MSTAQDSPRRKKQKIRRHKQLAAWRAKKEASGETQTTATATPAK